MDESTTLNTRVVHAGRAIDPAMGAVTAPIHLSTTFARDADGELMGNYLYSRTQNPNRYALETCLAELEGAQAGLCFASGTAALNTALQALEPGDHVLYSPDIYHGSRHLMTHLIRSGVCFVPVALDDPQIFQTALQTYPSVRLVLCETPTNPMLKVVDLERIAQQAHAAGALVMVDNTWATPLLQRPLELGCDLVLHSTTKYLAGHSDVTGGALLCADAQHPLWGRIAELQAGAGAIPSPFDCWLILRGIATLAVRMRAHNDNAEQIAAMLDAHPKVEAVHYPGLASHAGYAVAKRQMKRSGAMLSFQVHGGETAAARVLAHLKLIVRATSLGGVHSLAEHRYRVEGPDTATPHNLIRMSVGIEDPVDLMADLTQALTRGPG